jgi:hypothetical protein
MKVYKLQPKDSPFSRMLCRNISKVQARVYTRFHDWNNFKRIEDELNLGWKLCDALDRFADEVKDWPETRNRHVYSMIRYRCKKRIMKSINQYYKKRGKA